MPHPSRWRFFGAAHPGGKFEFERGVVIATQAGIGEDCVELVKPLHLGFGEWL